MHKPVQIVNGGQLAADMGVKMLAFGAPGSGKTPLVLSAPAPILLACEPGLLSLRGSKIATVEGYTYADIENFFAWLFESAEAGQFHTVAVDSLSQMAEIYLSHFLTTHKDGRAAYGEMARGVMKWCSALYFMKQKHIYLIAKESKVDDAGVIKKAAYFPGQELSVKIPHLFDVITRVGTFQVPGVAQATRALQCRSSFDANCRDRSGKLNEFEQPNLSALFAKCMSNPQGAAK